MLGQGTELLIASDRTPLKKDLQQPPELQESRSRVIESIGEPDRIRTCDLLIKSQLLYQLSYGPA